MRRRPRRLEVSTFPFLAVLLCTMGSLILLLLVLDCRAKIVALRKAADEAAQVRSEQELHDRAARQRTAEEERVADERRVEYERRRQELHALLALQEQDLSGKVEEARGQLAAAAAQCSEEQTKASQLQAQLQMAQMRLAGDKQALQTQHNAAAKAVELTDSAKRELARQFAELQQLEQTLANLKALRERQKNTYSLVPYLGRRGDQRQPLYLECSGSELVFHPDRIALSGPELTEQRIRDELEKRTARLRAQKPAGEPARPYLLMLVRPNGIMNYYGAQAALADAKVDFGYEFIEQDWTLDFGDDGPAQPWTVTAKTPALLPPPASIPKAIGGGGSGFAAPAGAGTPSGTAWCSGSGTGGSLSGPPGISGAGLGPLASSGMPAGPWRPAGPPLGLPGGAEAPGTTPGGLPRIAGGLPGVVGGLPGVAGGLPGVAGASAGGAGGQQPSTPKSAGTARTPAALGVPGGFPPAPPNAGGTAGGSGPAEVAAVLGSPGAQPPVAGSDTALATPGAPKDPKEIANRSNTPGSDSVVDGINASGTKAGKAPPPPIGRILGNRDWMLVIECRVDGVVLKFGNQRFSLETLSQRTAGEHPLTAAVRQVVARRQATVGPGEPPWRPLLRFQVWPSGLPAYYQAYPLLEALRLPMTRENVINP